MRPVVLVSIAAAVAGCTTATAGGSIDQRAAQECVDRAPRAASAGAWDGYRPTNPNVEYLMRQTRGLRDADPDAVVRCIRNYLEERAQH
jgi:hypothetical protein